MTVPLLLIFVILTFLVFVEDYLGKYKWLAFGLMWILMAFCAGFRPVGFDRDSENYQEFFLHPDSQLSDISVEPLFLAICRIVYLVTPEVQALFLVFALVGVLLKFYAIRNLTPLLFLSLVIYFGNFYMLHDITQIRAGIVSGLFLMSIKPMSEGKKLIPFCLIIFGCFIHISSLALLPLLFLNNKPIGSKMKIALSCIVPLCFVLYALNLDLLTSIPIPYVTSKVEVYKALSEYGSIDKESILNPFPLIKMAVFLYFLYFSKTIEQFVPSINLLIKILACSLIVYFAFSSVKIVSLRISELYGIVEIIAYPCIFFTIRPQYIGKVLVCLVALIEIYFNVVQWKFFDFDV